MIVFTLVVAIYVLSLACIKPAPASLKAAPVNWGRHVASIKVSLILGVALLAIFLVVSDFSFDTVNDKTYALLALNNARELATLWPLQVITHSFIHVNWLHLLTNVTGVGMLSVYERRVGARRYLAVLAVASVASMPSVVFHPVPTAITGISGGLYGLAAAYFTDNAELSFKDWLSFIAAFVLFAAFMAWSSDVTMAKTGIADFRVDHIGHALGALAAILYCRGRPLPAHASAV
ncbi:MAG: rhomboid family intramembrane serine protease [Methylococcaceae bacterium]|nr:rhomboid family intramembrane serine protease [Methylococcaceae bacterium]